jgi:hypothetical protein
MLRRILLVALAGVLLAVAGVLLLAARLPDSFHVARSASIAAPAERIFPLINDLRQMNGWSPFVKRDPGLQGSYSGPASGPGASYRFEGKEAGSGTLHITEATAPMSVRMTLDMSAPLAARNNIHFSLVPDGQGTRVTWTMEGGSPFVARVMDVLFNMDRMIGGAFEAGLADLKILAEKA